MSNLVVASTDVVVEESHNVFSTLRRRPVFWICLAALTVMVLLAVFPRPFAGLFGHPDPRACDLTDSLLPPSHGHPFGQDLQGCDIFAGVIYGTRASMEVGLLCTLISVAIALVLGSIAGYFGGWLDTLISRLTDVFLGFPFLLGAIVVLNSMPTRTPLVISLVLAIFSWPSLARVVRTSVRQVRDTEFVQAGRAMGLSTARIMLRYVLPNALGPLTALATLMVGSVISAEATLTFLGLGLRAPQISWGLQLNQAQQRFDSAPHMLLYPSLFLTVTVLSLILLGDTLRDVLNPKDRQ